MLGGILALLPGAFGLLNNLTDQITKLKISVINAKTDEERIAAQEQIATLEARRDVMVAESHSPWNGLMRFIIASSAASVLFKLFTWDKVIGSLSGCAGTAGQNAGCETFRTDMLDVNQWWVITAVVGFYFLSEAARSIRK